MYTSESKAGRKGALIYLGVSEFCLLFYLIYNRFSHGVHSPYMTWLFAWPFVLGFLPALVLWRIQRLPRAGEICQRLYHSGVAAVTVSSLLRGIFEIAGTASDYQVYLMYFGWVMLAAGAVAYLVRR